MILDDTFIKKSFLKNINILTKVNDFICDIGYFTYKVFINDNAVR